MQYSKERKEAVLKKMMPPHNRSIVGLALDVFQAGGAPAVEGDTGDEDSGHHRQVGPRQRLVEVRHRRMAPPAVGGLVDLEKAAPLLDRAVHVRVAGQPRLPAGLDKGPAGREIEGRVHHVHAPVGAVKGVRAALLPFGF